MKGYWQRPDLTEKVRLNGREDSYRTGDFGCWAGNGTIRFGGRRDAQVKIRGHRVELMEIESVLVAHPEVKEAAIILLCTRKHDTNPGRLCGTTTGGTAVHRGIARPLHEISSGVLQPGLHCAGRGLSTYLYRKNRSREPTCSGHSSATHDRFIGEL